ncbi:hypothetical protein MJA45_14340 [Paenibacillus aurantius]|uniref:EF-hand domain-containing protein n=1 Tax=Paenibacillus aurantius TaxID=2918900 RepID=A0AA96RD89_9BACL|nr:hypothetical protein [Paenibacillus aurantius]WNQ08833.1 hypothetical protein MJA45_14340 [Paenibacillus aurantius]
MYSRFLAAFLLLAVLLLLYAMPPSLYAHSFGTAGYSEISISGRTIDYELLLDHDQLLAYLPIDQDGNGTVDKKEWDNTTMIQEFMADHITVSADGIQGKPELTGASEVKRNEQSLIRFAYRYTFDQPVRSYEVDYRLYFNEFDNDHKNFAAVKASGTSKDKIFSKGSSVLQGTINGISGEAQGGHSERESGNRAFLWIAASVFVLAAGAWFIRLAGHKQLMR